MPPSTTCTGAVTQQPTDKPVRRPRTALFVTCLVDLYRPSVGFATVQLLEDAGCIVDVPSAQTCCGQPAFNSGDMESARVIARQLITTFEPYDYIVAPSGSCAGMLKTHMPELFVDDSPWHARATHFAARVHELTSFLVDELGVLSPKTMLKTRAAYHDSCSGLRELGVYDQPRSLLKQVEGLELTELSEPEVCCGFGGTFCVKYPEISARIVGNKADDVVATGADTLLSGDMGCLLNIAGRLRRAGSAIKVRHIAEVLAGMTEGPGIGDPS